MSHMKNLNKYEKGKVCEQKTEAGTKVAKNTRIDIVGIFKEDRRYDPDTGCIRYG